MSSTPKHEEQGEAQGNSDELDTSTRDQHPHEAETSSKPPNLTITNITGDLTVEPPDNAILIHSVNCLGVWGSGVALALAEALPGAYAAYQAICRQQSINELLGSALLIPPQDGDYDLTPRADGSVPTKPRRWLYCLFVSKGYGRATKAKPGKSTRAVIIENTMKTLRTVRALLYAQQRADEHRRDAGVSRDVIWACKFNSGSFGIAWETTLEIIKGIFERRDDRMWIGEMKVVSPA